MRKPTNQTMRIRGKFYKGYSMKMRLTANQLKLVKTVANSTYVYVYGLLKAGFNQSMIDCLVKKGAIWIDNLGKVSICDLRLKGFKLTDASFTIYQ